MLTRPDPLVVHYMTLICTQDDLLHDLPWHRGQTDRSIVSWILLSASLVDGCHIFHPPVLREDIEPAQLYESYNKQNCLVFQ